MSHTMVINAIMKMVHLVHKPTVDVDSVIKTMEILKGLYQPTTSDTIQVLESRIQLLQVQTTTASLADRLAEYFQCQDEITKERASLDASIFIESILLSVTQKALDALALTELELANTVNNWKIISLAFPEMNTYTHLQKAVT